MSKLKIHSILSIIFLIIVPAVLFLLSSSDLIRSHSLADIAILWGLIIIGGLSILAGLVFVIRAMRYRTEVTGTQPLIAQAQPQKINKRIHPFLLIIGGVASMTILPLLIAGPLFRSIGINLEPYFLIGGALLIILGLIAFFADL